MKIEFRQQTGFIETKAHARFVEFAEACVEHRYIGVCYGRPGVGKTRSAQEFAQWNNLFQYDIKKEIPSELESKICACRAVFITARVSNTPNTIDSQLSGSLFRFGHARLRLSGLHDDEDFQIEKAKQAVPLVIVDEVDRLTLKSFDHLRHIYDTCGMGLILMGMPGIEKRLARYPQFYSRIGFTHEFKPLGEEEMRFLLPRQGKIFGLTFDPEKFEHVDAMSIIIHITRGNFRLMERLLAQMKRIMSINNISEPSDTIVNAARNCLVIGSAD